MVENTRWYHFVGIFLISFATLLLELSLTRVLSVALWYHFGFLIISTALLGFGVSGVVLALWRWLREEVSLDHALVLLALAFGLLTIICFWLMQRIPFDPFSLFSDIRQIYFMPLYYIIISAPFFCSGLALALIFTRSTVQINRLYAFDLFGAGLGCAALAVVMPAFGGSGSVAAAAVLGFLAAAIFSISKSKKLSAICFVLSIAGFTSIWFADNILAISVTPNKPAPTTQPLYTAWNTFSRIDVYERPPSRQNGQKASRNFIFDAGTAATGMVDLRPGVRDYLKRNPNDADYFSGIAYLGKKFPKVLIIGSGGGAEVLDALHFGSRDITAVEINPIINEVVSSRMNDFWGGLFKHPGVRLITEEGRSFVRRSDELYDAIISVHTISNAAIASGALSLSENYVLTLEAFEDYLDHLTPDGIIFFTRPEVQISRLFATAREAMAKRNVTDISKHLYAFRYPPSGRQLKAGGADRPSFIAGFLLKKSPFKAIELNRIEEHLGVGIPPRSEELPAPEVLYSQLKVQAGSIYHTLVTAPDLDAVYKKEIIQLEPATDDRPFFNQHTRWSSITFQTFHDLFTQQQLGRLALEDRPVAEVTLLILLVQTSLTAAVFILLPLWRFSRAGLKALNSWRYLLYFAGLGLGFIMIEIGLIGRFTLFLGQPVYTLAVILASLLLFTGAGSYIADRFRVKPRRTLLFIIPLILVTLIVTTFIMPILFSAALGLALIWRIIISVILLAPLCVLMGMPFPIGMRVVMKEASALVPWSWGVNGFFTVIGTITALIAGMSYGFKTVLLIGAICYLAALVGMITIRKISKRMIYTQ
jgi:hypothetical protein